MLEFSVANERRQNKFRHDRGPVVFGRAPQGKGRHFVIDDPFVSRVQLSVESVEGGVRVSNHGHPLRIDGFGTLEANASQTFALPVTIVAGETKIIVEKASEEALAAPATDGEMRTLEWSSTGGVLESVPTVERLAEWFQTLLSVQRAAAGSASFYEETVRAIVDLIGLDRGIVLLRQGEEWKTVASHSAREGGNANYSTTVLAEVVKTRQTVYQTTSKSMSAASLLAVDAFVASPILDESGEVVGALFGARDRKKDLRLPEIEPLQAQVVQILAAAVSAGLARLAQEAEAGRLRVQFEQVFSPELVRELERNPRMLEPANRTITVLFSDLRGFSRLSEQLDGDEMFELVGEIMDTLTERVLEENGVIIDYYGDGMAAMWNAPLAHADHATRACRAALRMQADLGGLNERWALRLGSTLAIGIGIHTGAALVGNAGSVKRQKYGPRGHTVNLASRIEGATKHAGVPILLSADTKEAMSDGLGTRHIGVVRVVGIDDPVSLFELRGETDESWPRLRDSYEEAVTLFGQREISRAKEIVEALPDDDGPTRLLKRNIARVAADADEPTLIVLRSK